MFAVHWIKGTSLYCSEECMETDNPNAARVVGWPTIDSSEYIPDRPSFTGDGAAAWLAEHGWLDSKCDYCRAALAH